MVNKDEQSPIAGIMRPEDIRASYHNLLRSLQVLGPRLSERRTAAELQELSLRLGYFALALNHHMDGNTGKAESALARADARAARVPAFFTDRDVADGKDWSHVYH